MTEHKLAIPTVPAVPIEESEKHQQYELSQGRSLPMEGTEQSAPYSEPEFPSSSEGEGTPGQTCRQEPVEDHLARDRGQVLGRFSSRASATPTPPPDGGFAAWMCVLGTHLVVMNTWGVINSFGVFQSYYVEALHQSPSDISWIGSIEIFLLFFIGAIAGRLTDAGFFRALFLTGSVLIVGGALATSASSQYWQILLAQGVCVGLGNGCLFCPAVAVVSTYFQRRRSLALGLTACGSSTGGVLFPIMVRQLLPRIGFGWTMRTIALLQAVLLVVALLCLRPRIAPRRTGRLIDWAAFKEAEYMLYTLACFTCFWGTYFAFFYISTYSRDIQGMSYVDSLNLLLIINGVGTVGRILPNIIADRCGTLTIFIPTAAASALLMFTWIAITSVNGLYAWAAICGIPIGGIQSMFPSALAALTTDLRKQGTRIGMVFTVVSFSVLTGPPIEGALVSALGGQYLSAQLFAGVSTTLGMLLLVATRETKRRKAGLGLSAKV